MENLKVYNYLYIDEDSGEEFIVEEYAKSTIEARAKCDKRAKEYFNSPVRKYYLTEEEAERMGLDTY